MLSSEQERYLSALYFDPRKAGSYSGIQKMYKAVRKERNDISRHDIKVWLQINPVILYLNKFQGK